MGTAARDEGLTIIWVPIRPSLYRRTVIADYQAAHPPAQPLSSLDPAHQEDALVRIAERIEEALFAAPMTPPGAAAMTAPAATEPRPAEAVSVPSPTPLPAPQNIHGWPAAQVQARQQQTAQALKIAVAFRDTLQDGSPGPEMVVIPAGEFLMGSPKGESERHNSEGPQHKVVIAKPFAMGRYAVTFDEYDRFCQAMKREKPADQGWGRGRRPVINVTWEDSIAYCAWLSEQTGAAYRLPTEAEWENGPKGEYREQTVPVETFQPNPWGLYQVHGNVYEWAQDGWHENYDGAPADGSAWERGAGGPRVVRGGSWNNDRRWLRAANRYGLDPVNRASLGGFRLARTFPFPLLNESVPPSPPGASALR